MIEKFIDDKNILDGINKWQDQTKNSFVETFQEIDNCLNSLFENIEQNECKLEYWEENSPHEKYMEE